MLKSIVEYKQFAASVRMSPNARKSDRAAPALLPPIVTQTPTPMLLVAVEVKTWSTPAPGTFRVLTRTYNVKILLLSQVSAYLLQA